VQRSRAEAGLLSPCGALARGGQVQPGSLEPLHVEAGLLAAAPLHLSDARGLQRAQQANLDTGRVSLVTSTGPSRSV
jgi:hypothetical protein